MVHRDQQHVLVFGLPDQPPADQRSGFQIKPRTRLLFDQNLQLRRRILMFAQVMFHQMETAVFHPHDPLHRLSLHQHEGCAQRFMPRHDPIQRTPQRPAIQLPCRRKPKGM